jgi:hypothetical protein
MLIVPINISAQKKISVNVNLGIRNSIGKDLLKTYVSNSNSASVEYFSRKKYEHPYCNIITDVSYIIAPKLNIGLQTGLYLHFSEIYSSIAKRTTISTPLQLTGRYSIWDFKKKSIGIDLLIGMIFFEINERNIEKYKNGKLCSASFFFLMNKGIMKIGFEKEIDYVTIYFKELSPYFTNETFKYSIKRLSLSLSYGFLIKW